MDTERRSDSFFLILCRSYSCYAQVLHTIVTRPIDNVMIYGLLYCNTKYKEACLQKIIPAIKDVCVCLSDFEK